MRDVGKTPRWDVDFLSPYQWEDWAVRGGVEAQFTFWVECFDGPPWDSDLSPNLPVGLCPLGSKEAPGYCPGETWRTKFSRTSLADVSLLVKQSLSNLRYFSENVKLESDFFLLVRGRKSKSGLGNLAVCQVKTSRFYVLCQLLRLCSFPPGAYQIWWHIVLWKWSELFKTFSNVSVTTKISIKLKK